MIDYVTYICYLSLIILSYNINKRFGWTSYSSKTARECLITINSCSFQLHLEITNKYKSSEPRYRVCHWRNTVRLRTYYLSNGRCKISSTLQFIALQYPTLLSKNIRNPWWKDALVNTTRWDPQYVWEKLYWQV